VRHQLSPIFAFLTLSCATASVFRTPRDEATFLLKKGDAAGAVVLLEQLYRAAPGDLSLARSLAEAHVKAGSAEPFLKRLDTDTSATAHYLRGLIRFAQASSAAAPAIEAFQRAVELKPQEPEFHYRLGLALVESERYEEALSPLTQATTLAPQKTGWFLPLAKARAALGQTQNAVDAIATVVKGLPTPTEAKAAKALMSQVNDPFAQVPAAARGPLEEAFQWLGRPEVPQQAIGQLEAILKDFPDLGIVHSLLGLAYARLDDSGLAVEQLKKAIELSPRDGKSALYLASLFMQKQRTKSAGEYFEMAVTRDPTLEEAWSRLGELAMDKNDLPRAQTAFEIASHLQPDSVDAKQRLAAVYQLLLNWPKAEAELLAAQQAQEDNGEVILRLGLLYTDWFVKARTAAEKTRARTEAQRWLSKILNDQPENALASRALERVRAQ
jgi:tetratricopeptide (TPR) repeat protein